MALVAPAIALGDILGDVAVGAAASATYDAIKSTFVKAKSGSDNTGGEGGGSGLAQQVSVDELHNMVGNILGPGVIDALNAGTMNAYLTAHSGDVFDGEDGVLPAALQAARGASDAAAAAQTAAIGARSLVNGMLQGIPGYSLDGAGLAAFDADKVAGHIVGEGPLVQYIDDDGIPSWRIDPHYLTYLSPDGVSYINLFDVLRALTGDTHFHP
jgi:hypothetical protein